MSEKDKTVASKPYDPHPLREGVRFIFADWTRQWVRLELVVYAEGADADIGLRTTFSIPRQRVPCSLEGNGSTPRLEFDLTSADLCS